MESFSSLTITIFPSFIKKTIEIIQRKLYFYIAKEINYQYVT